LISRTFRAGEDQNYGGTGWIPTWIPEANAGDARLVAHDLLEHYVDTKGGAEGELMAMGCIVWGRVMAGAIQAYQPMSKVLGADVMNVLREVVYGNQTLTSPGRTHRIDDECVEDEINACIPEAIRMLKAEYEEEPTKALGLSHKEIVYRIRGWMRNGARQAENRYYKRHGVTYWQMAELYRKVQREVEKYRADDYLGAILKVSVNLKEQTVKCRLKEPEYY
jgi:hypothetical protein